MHCRPLEQASFCYYKDSVLILTPLLPPNQFQTLAAVEPRLQYLRDSAAYGRSIAVGRSHARRWRSAIAIGRSHRGRNRTSSVAIRRRADRPTAAVGGRERTPQFPLTHPPRPRHETLKNRRRCEPGRKLLQLKKLTLTVKATSKTIDCEVIRN
jgi:hypothetical protein